MVTTFVSSSVLASDLTLATIPPREFFFELTNNHSHPEAAFPRDGIEVS